MHQRAKDFAAEDAAPNLDSLDRLDAHYRLRQQAVELFVPVDVSAEAGGNAVDHYFEDAADGIARARGLFYFFLHAGFGLGINAAENDFIACGESGDLFPLAARRNSARPTRMTWLRTSMPRVRRSAWPRLRRPRAR